MGKTEVVPCSSSPEFKTNFTFDVELPEDADFDDPGVAPLLEMQVEIRSRHPVSDHEPHVPVPTNPEDENDEDYVRQRNVHY
jgi:hypothetical protein